MKFKGIFIFAYFLDWGSRLQGRHCSFYSQVTTMPDAELFHITSTLKIEQSILTSIQGTIQLRVEGQSRLVLLYYT